MKIWYDACTGKHIRYGSALAEYFKSFGYEILLTTRKHPDTTALAKMLGKDFLVFGQYSPKSLYKRLEEGLKRSKQLMELFKYNIPDIAISHQSVELCRVAFGLGIPIILTADTPYAYAVNRLTIPLANIVVASEAIPPSFFENYSVPKIVHFRGVDEVAWVRNFKPKLLYDLDRPLIVVREMENQASYALDKKNITKRIIDKLSSLGHVFTIPRYDKTPIENVVGKYDIIDSLSLVSQADLVVSAGGTTAREAALQGVPSIVISDFGETYVNNYLSKKDFPLFEISLSELFNIAKKTLGKRWDVKRRLLKLENPLEVIKKNVEKTLKTQDDI